MPGLSFPSGAVPSLSRATALLGNIDFASVAIGAGCVDLTTGRAGTNVTTTPTSKIYGEIGQAIEYTAGTDVSRLASGKPTGVLPNMTFASICQFSTVGGGFAYLVGFGTGSYLARNAAGVVFVRWGGTSTTANTSNVPSLLANVPYFIAASSDSAANTNFVCVRLDSGKLYVDAQAVGSVNASADGSVHVGNLHGGSPSTPAGAGIAATLIARTYSSPQRLRQLADDPWALWYQGVER